MSHMISPAEKASIESLRQIYECIVNKTSFRLEAGAGAGKTYSLIKSLIFILENQINELNKKNQKVACITYTNIATEEIKKRTDNHPSLFVDTIHSFSWNILHVFQNQLRVLISESQSWKTRLNGLDISDYTIRYDLGHPRISDKEISIHHDDVIFFMSKMLVYPKFRKYLKSKFPIIFIDEYQDTDKELATSIVSNLIENDEGFLIGLFGDHWQKIYDSKACGLIRSSSGKITEINKNANFRSDAYIVKVLNLIRKELPQEPHNPQAKGSIKVFHTNSWHGQRLNGGHWKGDLPADEVAQKISGITQQMIENGWDISSNKSKILFLTNNLIAIEQQFKNLANCFKYPEEYLKKENKYILFLLDFIEPVIQAFKNREYGSIFEFGKNKQYSLSCQDDKRLWAVTLSQLEQLRNDATIGDIIDFVAKSGILILPEAITKSETRFDELKSINSENLNEKDIEFLEFINKIRNISYQEVINLGEYIDLRTPFSTKHGVKGAEFDNVLVVLGRGWNKYNWDQMLHWMSDEIPVDKLETFERNRNLFYVCCSRAKHNLTLLFTQHLSDNALSTLSTIFGSEQISDIG
ncbi:ATP-dependent DNA helicase Rep [compost metagenome]